jgi:hypothetical protein
MTFPSWFFHDPSTTADRLETHNRYTIMMDQGCRACKYQGQAFDQDYCTQGRIPEMNNFCRKFEVK